jgi:hypothetical protein
MFSTIELYPRREVSSRYFYGYSCIYEDTVYLDSAQTQHLLPLERENACDKSIV